MRIAGWALVTAFAVTIASVIVAHAQTTPTAPATTASTGPATAPSTAPSGDSSGWTVVFRSDDPIVWNSSAGDPADENGYAVPMDDVPANVRYLRLTRKDTEDAVIIQITRDQLIEGATLDGDVQWRPATPPRGEGEETSQLLGIVRRSWPANANNEHLIVYSKNWRGYRGWGFSKAVGKRMAQTYSWHGEPIGRTVFEVAVKEEDLTDDERERLITDEKRIIAANAPGKKIARQQTSIHVVAIRFDESGAAIGGTEELILNATPGSPRDNTPVTYAIDIGDSQRLALEDAVWAVRLKHPRWEAARVDVRFDNRLREAGVAGAPVGAAVGTMLLSVLDGFAIDPDFVICGDVTADGTVRPVTATAGRIRAAAAGAAAILALPAENERHVADALVYEGWPALAKVQVIGVATLNDAVALARTDRPAALTDAIEMFAQVQDALSNSPHAVRTKVVRDKLTRVVELAPTHYSAKLLALVSQDKHPRKLSRDATLYHLAVATRNFASLLSEPAQAANKQRVTPAAVNEAIKPLERLRWIGDPSLRMLIDAHRDFLRELGEIDSRAGSLKGLQARARAVDDAEKKAGVDRTELARRVRDGT